MLTPEPINIIMVTYHRPNDLHNCINSILLNTKLPFRLSIIDNSMGAIDAELNVYSNHPAITIYKNPQNIGKGASYQKWYSTIMREMRYKYFISMDSDVQAPPSWLMTMISIANEISNIGILAPVLMSDERDTFQKQLLQNKLTMHVKHEMQEIQDGVYYNSKTAGPLLLLNRQFYESCGGYPGTRLFGNDDGALCKKAKQIGLFIGFTSKVACIHLSEDNQIGYREWKARNVNKAMDHKGHWD